MKKGLLKITPILLLTLACDPEPILLEPGQIIADAGHTGVFVLSEGLFNQNNSTLSWIDFGTGKPDSWDTGNGLSYDSFEKVNGRRIGDTANDMVAYDGDLYIVVNVSKVLLRLSGAGVEKARFAQFDQLGEPRYLLNDELLDLEADCLPFMRTNLLIGTGIQGVRVPDADSASEVDTFARQMYDSALVGNPYTAIIGKVEFQELQPASTLKASEFFLAMQSIDNILLSTYGIENTGVYEKKAHILESENAVNASNASLVMQDGLSQRQNFCNIVNSLWNLGIWCELSETVSQADINGDGVLYDESTDGAGSGHSVEPEGGDE